jgi:hypothetical protein
MIRLMNILKNLSQESKFHSHRRRKLHQSRKVYQLDQEVFWDVIK